MPWSAITNDRGAIEHAGRLDRGEHLADAGVGVAHRGAGGVAVGARLVAGLVGDREAHQLRASAAGCRRPVATPRSCGSALTWSIVDMNAVLAATPRADAGIDVAHRGGSGNVGRDAVAEQPEREKSASVSQNSNVAVLKAPGRLRCTA